VVVVVDDSLFDLGLAPPHIFCKELLEEKIK
jgi:hypothetical protein